MSTCPHGHASAAADYCDTCGSPMVAASAPPSWAGPTAGDPGANSGGSGGSGAGSGGSTAGPSGVGAGTSSGPGTWDDGSAEQSVRICPHCGAASSPTYLFCEDCGYDFTTGALPMSLSEGLAAIDTRVPAQPATAQIATSPPPPAPDPPAVPEAPDAPAVPEAPAVPDPPAVPGGPPTTSPDGAAAPRAQVTQAPGDATPAGSPTLDPPAAPATGPRPTNQAPSRRAVGDWVVEVWIDPAWYAVQSSDEACPSPAVPDIVRISGRTLVGRYSASRHIVPDVDCGADSGVSRRHAEFTTDGRRWWVEDLGSSNGTYVAPASGPLPADPIPAGQRVEIDDDDRIYVGAWTRLVLRRATASEVAGTG